MDQPALARAPVIGASDRHGVERHLLRGSVHGHSRVDDLLLVVVTREVELLLAVRPELEGGFVQVFVLAALPQVLVFPAVPGAAHGVLVLKFFARDLVRNLFGGLPGDTFLVTLPLESDLVYCAGGDLLVAALQQPVLVAAVLVRPLDPRGLVPLVSRGVEQETGGSLNAELESLAPGVAQGHVEHIRPRACLLHLLRPREGVPGSADEHAQVGVVDGLDLVAESELATFLGVAAAAVCVVSPFIAKETRLVFSRDLRLRYRSAVQPAHGAQAPRAGHRDKVDLLVEAIVVREQLRGGFGPLLAATEDLTTRVRATDAERGHTTVPAVLAPRSQLRGEVHRVALDRQVRVQELEVLVGRGRASVDHHDALREACHACRGFQVSHVALRTCFEDSAVPFGQDILKRADFNRVAQCSSCTMALSRCDLRRCQPCHFHGVSAECSL
mmetsp:Transcript_110502/g.312567  ORF Transcript_110502/g.312567 Transcript_110502/m.312567 type:complete len:443 (-) Transcript_110502:1943-3271(-)